MNSDKSMAIVEALHNASCGQDVYDALHYVPTKNLKDMKSMIEHILEKIDKSN